MNVRDALINLKGYTDELIRRGKPPTMLTVTVDQWNMLEKAAHKTPELRYDKKGPHLYYKDFELITQHLPTVQTARVQPPEEPIPDAEVPGPSAEFPDAEYDEYRGFL